MTKPKVLFIVNKNAPESFPVELATHLNATDLEITIVFFYKNSQKYNHANNKKVIEIGSKGKIDIKAIFSLFILIKKIKPDIIHCNHTISALFSSIFGRLLMVPVIIFTVHNDHRSMKSYQNIINFFTFIFVDSIVCNSNNTKERLLFWEKIVAYKKAITIYNGVDIQRIKRNIAPLEQVLKNNNFSKNSFLLVSVGRLVWQKDFITLINAMNIVRKENNKTKLIIVGGGELYGRINKRIKQLGLVDSVKMTGILDRNDVYKIINAADCFIIASVYEGFCTALVEAMVASKPIIYSNIKVFEEVISNLGVSVKKGDEKKFADAILKMADENEDERNIKGIECKRRAEDLFSIEKTAENYCLHYKYMLKNKVKKNESKK